MRLPRLGASTTTPRAVHALVDAGWQVEADGKIFRRPGAFHLEVSSGVDWFELKGGARILPRAGFAPKDFAFALIIATQVHVEHLEQASWA